MFFDNDRAIRDRFCLGGEEGKKSEHDQDYDREQVFVHAFWFEVYISVLNKVFDNSDSEKNTK